MTRDRQGHDSAFGPDTFTELDPVPTPAVPKAAHRQPHNSAGISQHN